MDELDSLFEVCFASLVIQNPVNGSNQEEMQPGVDNFLEVSGYCKTGRIFLPLPK